MAACDFLSGSSHLIVAELDFDERRSREHVKKMRYLVNWATAESPDSQSSFLDWHRGWFLRQAPKNID
jgi:hypothetical protein